MNIGGIDSNIVLQAYTHLAMTRMGCIKALVERAMSGSHEGKKNHHAKSASSIENKYLIVTGLPIVLDIFPQFGESTLFGR